MLLFKDGRKIYYSKGNIQIRYAFKVSVWFDLPDIFYQESCQSPISGSFKCLMVFQQKPQRSVMFQRK